MCRSGCAVATSAGSDRSPALLASISLDAIRIHIRFKRP
jgi:hypothetical protein